jgi:hypothetical protein
MKVEDLEFNCPNPTINELLNKRANGLQTDIFIIGSESLFSVNFRTSVHDRLS